MPLLISVGMMVFFWFRLFTAFQKSLLEGWQNGSGSYSRFRMSWMLDFVYHGRFFLLGRTLRGMHCFAICRQHAVHSLVQSQHVISP